MRHMQDPSQPQTQAKQLSIERPSYPSPTFEKTTSPPIDSAYASSIEKQPPPPELPKTGPGETRQPVKGFTLFPPARQPAAPNFAIPLKQNSAKEDQKSVATSMSKGRSFGSMRKYFRKGSKMWSE